MTEIRGILSSERNMDGGELEHAIARELDRGDLRAAATAAIRGYGPQLLGYLVAILHDEDVAREVFARFSEDVWKGLGGFRRESAFRTWAYRLAWHAACRFRREEARHRFRRLETSEAVRIADTVRTSAPILGDRVARLRHLLDPHDLTLLILRLDRELSWIEVATVMATPERPVTPASLRKRYERLKRRLAGMARRQQVADARG